MATLLILVVGLECFSDSNGELVFGVEQNGMAKQHLLLLGVLKQG